MTGLMKDILSWQTVMIVIVAIMLVFIHSLLSEKQIDVFALLGTKNRAIRWGVYYVLMLLIQISMSYGTSSEAFLYAVF